MINFNLDILYLIFHNLDFLSKIRFRNVAKYYRSLNIYNFYNISNKYLYLLDDNILSKYSFIKYLQASNNFKITNAYKKI